MAAAIDSVPNRRVRSDAVAHKKRKSQCRGSSEEGTPSRAQVIQAHGGDAMRRLLLPAAMAAVMVTIAAGSLAGPYVTTDVGYIRPRSAAQFLPMVSSSSTPAPPLISSSAL